MSDRLHPFLLVLALLDLGFVHTTGAVSAMSLAPLWGLALASPWLRRLQRFAVYRLLWNGGVLLLFALLAQHAAASGLANLLEDGLLLAALCQVHLLNNVGRRQQPDLVFLNSLLIAFVTSCFGSDGPWFTLFALHALAFAPALQARARAGRHGETVVPARRTLRAAAPLAVVVAAGAAAAFVLWPRDFDREGWLQTAIAARVGLTSGIGERIELEVGGTAVPGDGVVMRITPLHLGDEVPTHWRSVAYSNLVNGSWVPQNAVRGQRVATDPLWRNEPNGRYGRQLARDGPRLRVELIGRPERRLPVPLNACELDLRNGLGYVADPRPYGVIALAPLEGAPSGALTYEIQVARAQAPRRPDPLARELLTSLPDDPVTTRAGALAARMALADTTPRADPESIARRCADWLRANRSYELPGRPGFATSFAAFLDGVGAGHCEYFASALALVLRGQGIPARVVGGYLAAEAGADGTVIVRSRHAHAWVEALRDDGTWLTLDATPASATAAPADADAPWWRWPEQAVHALWSGVAQFDAARRRRLFARVGDVLRGLPAQALHLAADQALPTASLLALAAAWFYSRRPQRRRPHAVASLLQAVRGAGLRLEPGETPRELLARAQADAIAAERIATLAAAVRRHERQRYRRREERSR